MGYMHIDNLYKNQEVLMFREVYALEKIHGTSAHISWKPEECTRPLFFSGGAKHEEFVKLFDEASLIARFTEMGVPEITVYGEAYGGKLQGMKATYGDKLRFVVFDVKIGDSWLVVPSAEKVAQDLGLEFVHYRKCPTDIEVLNRERDLPSVQAARNIARLDAPREGIVLRPLMEVVKNNGARLIAKHKGEAFSELAHQPKVNVDKLVVMQKAEEIARQWVTHMRLMHVLDMLAVKRGTGHIDIGETGEVIRAMLEDIKREGENEIEWSKEAERVVCTAAAKLFKSYLKGVFGGQTDSGSSEEAGDGAQEREAGRSDGVREEVRDASLPPQ